MALNSQSKPARHSQLYLCRSWQSCWLPVAHLPMLGLRMRRINSGRKVATLLIVLFLCLGPARAASSNKIWNKIRYEAGTVDAKVNPFDWNTTLRVLPAGIEIVFEARKKIFIEKQDVTTLSYGETAYRKVAQTLSNATSRPVPLFGIVRNSKDHLVGIEFRNGDGTRGAVLLMVHKDSYSDLLQSLSSFTGQSPAGAP